MITTTVMVVVAGGAILGCEQCLHPDRSVYTIGPGLIA